MATVGKHAQRRALQATLRALSPEALTSLSTAACDRAASTAVFRASTAVSVYLSMPKAEVQTQHLLATCFSSGKRVFVPKVTGAGRHDMDMIEVRDMEELKAFPVNKWGIPEPEDGDGRASCLAGDCPIQLVLVPGLGFSDACARLGHGKGYYDTAFHTLSQLPGKMPILMGLAFDEQITDVAVDDHDWLLDCVATPTRLIEAPGPAKRAGDAV